MLQIALGVLMAIVIGAFSRWFDIPSSTLPRLIGALLVFAMTVGFLIADRRPAAGRDGQWGFCA
jgi:XapX domain-containing protein